MIVAFPTFIAYQYLFFVNIKLKPQHLSTVSRYPHAIYKTLVICVNGYEVFTLAKIVGHVYFVVVIAVGVGRRGSRGDESAVDI